MPTSVVYNEGATWGQQALESTGNLAKQLVQGKSDIGSILSEFGTGMAPMIARMAGVGLGAVVGKVFGALAVAVGGGGIVSGISKAARIVQNPYEEQLFNGIDFRTFTFDFAFAMFPCSWNFSSAVKVDLSFPWFSIWLEDFKFFFFTFSVLCSFSCSFFMLVRCPLHFISTKVIFCAKGILKKVFHESHVTKLFRLNWGIFPQQPENVQSWK